MLPSTQDLPKGTVQANSVQPSAPSTQSAHNEVRPGNTRQGLTGLSKTSYAGCLEVVGTDNSTVYLYHTYTLSVYIYTQAHTCNLIPKGLFLPLSSLWRAGLSKPFLPHSKNEAMVWIIKAEEERLSWTGGKAASTQLKVTLTSIKSCLSSGPFNTSSFTPPLRK